MGVNLFSDFRLWEAESDKDGQFVGLIKKQLGVPKRIWFGMPVLVANTTIGKMHFREPTMFFVVDFNRHSVTLKSIADAGYTGDEEADQDDEIDLDPTDNREPVEITVTRSEFYKLLEPQIPPGTDMQKAAMGLQGGGGF